MFTHSLELIIDWRFDPNNIEDVTDQLALSRDNLFHKLSQDTRKLDFSGSIQLSELRPTYSILQYSFLSGE